jgi:hypothetical protein
MDAPHKLRFDKVCMGTKIDHGIMVMFDNQDEEDDFYGLDKDYRDVMIPSIAMEIYRRLIDCNFIMIFLMEVIMRSMSLDLAFLV